MEIRSALKEDLQEIIRIESICFPESEAAKEDDIRKRFDAFSENFIVAADNGRIVGFINGCTTDAPKLPDELYHDTKLHKKDGAYQTVFGLDVLPEYRHKGVAAQLMNHLIELSKERGKKGMVLTCKNHLIHYYEKFGFRHQGVSESEHGGAVWNDMLLIF
ncbi:GNAT family N-acetyltransferase [uncultured Clostridium sp.]|uniref:GNAT family N-acetyltransferase n=1 Tax=uncultured Clostridium sp. TaxID=59620 RepID=UPI0025D183F7|nr:GNAT family N-acetyltransferase [uncultured Clostridium sp.]